MCSASNYSSSGNHGAFLRFSPGMCKGCKEIRPINPDTLSVTTDETATGKNRKVGASRDSPRLGGKR